MSLTMEYKLVNPDIKTNEIQQSTTQASGFDVSIPYFENGTLFTVYPSKGIEEQRKVVDGKITVNGGDTVIIKTNLAFNIPDELDMLVLVRSSIGIKRGLQLPNSVALIDTDYTQELMIALTNTRQNVVQLEVGERVVQCKMTRKEVPALSLVASSKKFVKNSNRVGGIGSTGRTTTVKAQKKDETTTTQEGVQA